jgi:hypothetical protein
VALLTRPLRGIWQILGTVQNFGSTVVALTIVHTSMAMAALVLFGGLKEVYRNC